MGAQVRMTEKNFAAKVEWEGGVFAALEYGLTAEDCTPGPLRDAWAALEVAYAPLVPHVERINELVESIQSTAQQE